MDTIRISVENEDEVKYSRILAPLKNDIDVLLHIDVAGYTIIASIGDVIFALRQFCGQLWAMLHRDKPDIKERAARYSMRQSLGLTLTAEEQAVRQAAVMADWYEEPDLATCIAFIRGKLSGYEDIDMDIAEVRALHKYANGVIYDLQRKVQQLKDAQSPAVAIAAALAALGEDNLR